MSTTRNYHALSTQVLFAPNNIGFTHTDSSQFFYFSGSEAGARTTFGSSVSELITRLKELKQQYQNKPNSLEDTCAKICQDFTKIVENAEAKAKTLADGQAYQSADEVASSLLQTGHVPIILSYISPAAVYEVATRSIQPSEVSIYFDKFPPAHKQASEYLTKQDIMRLLADFIKELHFERYQSIANEPLLYFYNQLIQDITSLVKWNQSTMPKEYEQFDLYSRFVAEILLIQSQISKIDPLNNLIHQIMEEVNISLNKSNCYRAQQTLSDSIYNILIKFTQEHIGITKGTKDIELSENQSFLLQAISPLLVYLNAPTNPFARNGLFGSSVSNSFYLKALESYRAQEEKMYTNDLLSGIKFDKPGFDPEEEIEFSNDQITQLLFGFEKNQNKQKSFFDRISNTLMELTDSSTSLSEQRRHQLALPTPEIYQLLEAPKEENSNQMQCKR